MKERGVILAASLESFLSLHKTHGAAATTGAESRESRGHDGDAGLARS
jgi:hypothetical protein